MSDADDSKADEATHDDDESKEESTNDASSEDTSSEKETSSGAEAVPAEPRRKRPRQKARAPQPEPSPISGPLVIVAVVALVAGGVGGWFGHRAQAKAELMRDSAPAASGSAGVSGPCGAWQQKICTSFGEHSASCEEAKNATDLLTTATCEAAIQALPATMNKVKAARAICEKLVTKLCADLPPGSRTCDMVKERTTSFPTSRCEQMLASYDQVIAQLKMMDQQQGMGMGMSGGHPQMGGPGGPQMGGPRPPGVPMGHPGAPMTSPAPAPAHP